MILLLIYTGTVPEKGSYKEYSWKCRLATFTTCFPFGCEADLASVRGPHILGFHPDSKEVRTLGHLGASFTNCAPGRKGKKEEDMAAGTTLRYYDPADTPYITTHPSRHSDAPRAKKPSWAVGCPGRPPGRKDKPTHGPKSDSPPPHPRFPVTSNLPRPHPDRAKQGAHFRGPTALFTLVIPTPTTNTRFRSGHCEMSTCMARTLLGTGPAANVGTTGLTSAQT